MARIVVVGSSFAGFTAAIELRNKLGHGHEVVVVSKTDEFLFMPSLIWVPFGLRDRRDITFPLGPAFEKHGVVFHHTEATGLDLEGRRVQTLRGDEAYDYLVIATGPKSDYTAIDGLGPHEGHTQSIMSWEDAEVARSAFEAFVEKPGPVVVGAVQGASCFGAAYEFLFNMAHQLDKRGLLGKAPITFVTPEPFPGHFGLGGFGLAKKLSKSFFDSMGIEPVTNASISKIAPGEIRLHGGRDMPFSYAMLVPSFMGVDVVREQESITNAHGFVKVNGFYQTEKYPEIFAAGVAVALDAPEETPVPCGSPKTGYLSEEMARIVAHNIAATIHGDKLVNLPAEAIDATRVRDAGDAGIIMLADHFLEPREQAWLIPGPDAHWAKLAFERYFLATRRRGRV